MAYKNNIKRGKFGYVGNVIIFLKIRVFLSSMYIKHVCQSPVKNPQNFGNVSGENTCLPLTLDSSSSGSLESPKFAWHQQHFGHINTILNEYEFILLPS